jgi:hypothetical protein
VYESDNESMFIDQLIDQATVSSICTSGNHDGFWGYPHDAAFTEPRTVIIHKRFSPGRISIDAILPLMVLLQ